MANKRDVLRILQEDYDRKRGQIREKFRAMQDLAMSREKLAKDAVKARFRTAYEKLVKRFHGTSRSDKPSVGWWWPGKERPYSGVSLDIGRYPSVRSAKAKIIALDRTMEKEQGELCARKEKIRRYIMLHGVDDNLLDMLASL